MLCILLVYLSRMDLRNASVTQVGAHGVCPIGLEILGRFNDFPRSDEIFLFAQIEPALKVLKGSAILAVNDEYIEPNDQLALKVAPADFPTAVSCARK